MITRPKLQLIREFLINYYGLLTILLVSLVMIVLPFLLSNNLEGLDSSGHLASIHYIKNFFWPWPDGWNVYLLSGFPQGFFYASAFHWLAAALSFVLSIEMAVKVLLVVSIILFPVGAFLLAKKIVSPPIIASIAAILSSSFYFFDLGLNDNMFSDLLFGMLSHLFSLTFFIFFIWSLARLGDNANRWRLSMILLTVTTLSHSLTGFAALLFVIIMFFFVDKNKELRRSLLKILLFSMPLLIFWLGPVIKDIAYSSGSDVSASPPLLITISAPFIFFLNFLAFKKMSAYSFLFKTISLVTSLIIFVSVFGTFVNLDTFAFHSARFLVYALILTPVVLVYVLKSYKINWPMFHLVCLASFFFYIIFLRIIPVGPFSTELLGGINEHYTSGRVIVLGSSQNLDSRFHTTRMKLAVEHEILVAEGLFVESSANGWFIVSLLNSWDGPDKNFVWAYNNLQNVADLSWGARIFGINYEYRVSDFAPTKDEHWQIQRRDSLIFENDLFALSDDFFRLQRDIEFRLAKTRILDNEDLIDKLGTNKTGFYYQSLYKVHDTDLAEAVYLPPVNIEKDWSDMTKKWWSSDWLKSSASDYLYDKPLLVYQAPVADWQISSEKIDFTVQNIGTKMDSFIVDASTLSSPAPIYVKVGYFPFWQAYDESGQRLEVYKASPNFMLVYGRGQITFKYVKPFYYYVGYIISGLTLLLLILSYLYQKRRKLLKKE